MRLVNDREDQREQVVAGFFPVAFYSLLAAIGVTTPMLAPLPIIAAHTRLPEPWPKLVTVIGAVIAIVFLSEPVSAVVVGFVFGLVAADFVSRGASLPRLFLATLGASLGAGLLMLSIQAAQHGVGLLEEWKTLVVASAKTYEQVRNTWAMQDWLRPEEYQHFFLSQGPFLLLGFFGLCLWLCVGFTAHLGWWKPEHPYSAVSLRGFRLPGWLSIAFMLSLLVGSQVRGAQFILGILMVVQGCVLMSNWFSQKRFAHWARAVIYAAFFTFGLGIVAGLGVVAPLLFKRFKQEA